MKTCEACGATENLRLGGLNANSGFAHKDYSDVVGAIVCWRCASCTGQSAWDELYSRIRARRSAPQPPVVLSAKESRPGQFRVTWPATYVGIDWASVGKGHVLASDALGEVENQLALVARLDFDLRMLKLLGQGWGRNDLQAHLSRLARPASADFDPHPLHPDAARGRR